MNGSQLLDGSAAKPVTDFKTETIFRYDWSRDGKKLARARGTVTSDVMLIKNLDEQTRTPQAVLTVRQNLIEVMLQVDDIVSHQIFKRDRFRARHCLEGNLLQRVQRARRTQFFLVRVKD